MLAALFTALPATLPGTLSQRARCRGVTLIELMIVVVVVGIVARVAYPSYISYVQRGYVGGAIAQLSTLAYQLEQYYQDNKTYTATSNACGTSTGSILIDATHNNTTTNAPNFTFSCQDAATVSGGVTTYSDQTFTITAQGTGQMASYAFTVDYQGNRKTTAFPGLAAAALPKSCWLLKVGDC